MVDKSGAKIRSMFDEISPRYDFLNHLLSLNVDVAWRRRAAERCAGPALALDVCSGTGDLAFEIRRRWGAKVVASDFSGGMLRLGARKSERRSQPLAIAQADTTRLPFRDGLFDSVSVAFGIRNVGDLRAGLSEMLRVAKPGGRVVILEFTPPEGALLRTGYGFYFTQVLPRIGRFFSRSNMDAYRYLPESVGEWPSPEDFSSIVREAGPCTVTWEPLSFGIAAIHVATKQASGRQQVKTP